MKVRRYYAIFGYYPISGDRPSKSLLLASNRVEQKTMNELWHSTEPESIAEFHWRLTLIFSVVIMALMVVPLSGEVNPRQGRVLSMFTRRCCFIWCFPYYKAPCVQAVKKEKLTHLLLCGR